MRCLIPWKILNRKITRSIYFCLLTGGIKCPVCSFVYGTKWEFNRHLKNKHGMKLVEHDGEAKWEVKQSFHGFGPTISGSYGEKVKDKKYSKVCSQLYIRTGGHVISHHHFQCTHSCGY